MPHSDGISEAIGHVVRDPDMEGRARRAVLWRVEHGRLSAEDAHTALAALGLLDAGPEVPW